jgi:hypothetical protein
MKLNLFFKFLKKYEIIILLILVLFVISFHFSVISFHFSKVIEGWTSCTQPKNCSDCVNAQITDTSSPCYWSSSQNQCDSFGGVGFSRSCSSVTSCEYYGDCSSCVNGKANGNPCYWNNTNNQCGSTSDNGYSNTCNSNVTSCMFYRDCSSCINGTAGPDNHLCYWNGNAQPGNKCVGYAGGGYKRQCPVTSCGDYIDCSSCVKGTVNGNLCYWNSSNSKCISNSSNGSRNCPSCPDCSKCQDLILLKNPTYITQQ